MAAKPVKLNSFQKSPNEQIRDLAATLKVDEGIPLSEVAAELDLPIYTVRNHAHKIGGYVVLYRGGKPAAFLVNPKHLAK